VIVKVSANGVLVDVTVDVMVTSTMFKYALQNGVPEADNIFIEARAPLGAQADGLADEDVEVDRLCELEVME
jgi:hypothetical protein